MGATDPAVFRRSWRSIEAVVVLALLLPASVLHAAAGGLDPSFGSGGIVTTSIGSPPSASDRAHALVLQPDGRIVVAGAAFSNTAPSDFALARYNPDGSVDTSFGNAGVVLTDIVGSDEAYAVALQPDGKIIAAGYELRGDGTPAKFAVVRYEAHGALDTSFGAGGMVTTALGGAGAVAYAVAIQSDGKVLVAGVNLGSTRQVALVRYNANGVLDSGFGSGGLAITAIDGRAAEAAAMVVQPDGKIVLAGRAFDGTTDNFALLRYVPNGSLDPSFDGDGIVTTPVGPDFDRILSVALQSDGRVVASGQACDASSSGCGFAVARYLPDGLLDSSFGTAGTVRTAVGSGSLFDAARGVIVAPGGTIVAAGSSVAICGGGGGCSRFVVVRYDANGTFDAAFGNGGVVTTDLGGRGAQGNALAVQVDGRLVVAGTWSPPIQGEDFALVRYLGSECGNGRIEGGENCDDGNLLGSDGCDATCQLEPTPTPTATATLTPVATATPSGSPTPTATETNTPTVTSTPTATLTTVLTATPTAEPTPGVCGDGTQDLGEECDDGNLMAADGCSPTCTLEPCVAAPIPSCLEAAQAKLSSSEKASGKEKLKLQWTKVTTATSQRAFGDPVSGTTRVALCLYDDAGTLVRGLVVDKGGQSCDGKPCWVARSAKGFAYKDKATASDGIGKIGYAAGAASKGRADAVGANNTSKGQAALPIGIVAALSGNTHPTMQLVTSDGFCLGAVMTEVLRDDGLQYRARKK